MNYVSGAELFLWRQKSRARAIANGIASRELDWLLQEMSDLDSLSLRLESFCDRYSKERMLLNLS